MCALRPMPTKSHLKPVETQAETLGLTYFQDQPRTGEKLRALSALEAMFAYYGTDLA